MPDPRILGVIDEDPFAVATWSGLSAYLFRALQRRGALYQAISAEAPPRTRNVYKALSVRPSLASWRFRYSLHLGLYGAMTRVAKRQIEMLDATAYDTILQIGAWYDLTGTTGKRVVSYHDGNLATLLASPFGHPPLSRRVIQRTLEYERSLYQRMHLVMPMSRWLADSFIRDNGVPARRVVPVGAGSNLPAVRPTDGKNYDAPRLLFVGKAFERKGGPVLLEAFARVRREVPDAELTIIGPELQDVPAGVRSLGFLSKSDPVQLERLLDEYARATVFVMPSLYEPYGVVFGEAMAHRLPCVGTTNCAIPEIILDGVTGFHVPVGEAAPLAERLITLLRDPALCRAMGDEGYRKYHREHTWESVVDRMCTALGQLS